MGEGSRVEWSGDHEMFEDFPNPFPGPFPRIPSIPSDSCENRRTGWKSRVPMIFMQNLGNPGQAIMHDSDSLDISGSPGPTMPYRDLPSKTAGLG